jgi:hypothetical protein
VATSKPKPKKASKHKTEAMHLQSGNDHIVGVKSLRVLIMPDGDSWFAQGLEIDYAACGDTVEEAKKNFGHGLHLTICEHIRLHGTIENLLKVAPMDAWQEFYKAPANAIKQSYSQLTGVKRILESDEADVTLPFDGIEYLEAAA